MRQNFVATFGASLVLAFQTAPALAEQVPPVTRTVAAEVFGDDPCPKARADEIVVCARQPENERYRIPKRFRDPPHDLTGPSASWGAKVEQLEAATRWTMPNGCSPSGSNGQTGCTQQMIHQWYLERHLPTSDTP